MIVFSNSNLYQSSEKEKNKQEIEKDIRWKEEKESKEKEEISCKWI